MLHEFLSNCMNVIFFCNKEPFSNVQTKVVSTKNSCRQPNAFLRARANSNGIYYIGNIQYNGYGIDVSFQFFILFSPGAKSHIRISRAWAEGNIIEGVLEFDSPCHGIFQSVSHVLSGVWKRECGFNIKTPNISNFETSPAFPRRVFDLFAALLHNRHFSIHRFLQYGGVHLHLRPISFLGSG